jgi:uncharacterized protein YciI
MKTRVPFLAWHCVPLFFGFMLYPITAQENQEKAAKSTFLVIYRPGPSWVQGKKLSEQPLKEHGQYMMSLYAKGSMKFAGPFNDDAGGALVLEVTGEAEARAIVAEDPAVKSGVFLHEIHPWTFVQWDKSLKK